MSVGEGVPSEEAPARPDPTPVGETKEMANDGVCCAVSGILLELSAPRKLNGEMRVPFECIPSPPRASPLNGFMLVNRAVNRASSILRVEGSESPRLRFGELAHFPVRIDVEDKVLS